MPHLLTAVWSPQWGTFKNLDLQAKARNFVAAARAAHAAMATAAIQMNIHAPVYLFALPEYYFVEDDEFGLLTARRKDTTESIVRVVSGQCADMVIVPGSINYRMEAGGLKAALARGRPERDYSANSYCPVYANGRLLNRYYKRFNDGVYDDSATSDAYFTPGNKAANFEFKGIRFGVDICGDYGESRLAGDVGEGGLDVHVLVSGTHVNVFDATSRIAARDGGFFVHSDSDDHPFLDKQKNGVWAVRRGHGMHDRQGRGLSDYVSDTSLANPALANIDRDTVIDGRLRDYRSRSGPEVTKNVTRQTPLKATTAGFTNIKVYTCPL